MKIDCENNEQHGQATVHIFGHHFCSSCYSEFLVEWKDHNRMVYNSPEQTSLFQQ